MRSEATNRAMPGLPDAKNRAEHDYYRTPRRAVEALLNVETFEGRGWEPACGDGAISEIFEERGLSLHSTDLIDRGYGSRQLDFLSLRTVDFPTVSYVVTNPPFKLAQPFAERALEVATNKVAFLCRTLWVEGMKRQAFFIANRPARIWVFSKRVNVARAGDARWRDGEGGMVSFSWFVWDKNHTGKTELDWL